MKKIAVFVLLVLLISPLFGDVTFTDSLGRVRTIKKVERVIAAGRPAEMMIAALNPELLVGITYQMTETTEKFFPYMEGLPLFGKFYGAKSNLNREALIMADPDVIIDIGEIKDGISEDLDRLEKETGIPVVFIESYLENTPTALRKLSTLLGTEEKGEVLASFAEETIARGKRTRESVGKEKSIYYSPSEDALLTYPAGSFHTESIKLAGGKNVIDGKFQEGGGKVTLEELFMLSPEYIILSNEKAYEIVKSDKKWALLDAVGNNHVYKIPSVPYSFVDAPPALNRLIGIDWLSKLLYPEENKDLDVKERVREFYRLFYNHDLSGEELDEILEDSL